MLILNVIKKIIISSILFKLVVTNENYQERVNEEINPGLLFNIPQSFA